MDESNTAAFSDEKTNNWNCLAVKMCRSRQCEDIFCSFIHDVSGVGVGAEHFDFESLQLTARFVISLCSGSSGEPLSRLLPRARGFRRGGVPGSRSRSRTDALAAHCRCSGWSFGLIVQLLRWAIPTGIEECSLHAFVDACALCTLGPAGHIPLGW